MQAMRRSVWQIRSYSQKIDPSTAFDFIPARPSDKDDIVKLCVNEFIHVEPHSKALKLTEEASRNIFEYIAAKSLHYPYSYRIHEKDTGRLIGFRLLSIGHRDPSLDVEPVPLAEVSHPGAKRICEILEESKAKMWRWADDGVRKVLRREITYVTPRHQRKGIANFLIHLGLDFKALRSIGVHGITSEASSLANQRLLEKHGYVCVGKPDYKLEMHDGNEGVKVYFKDLRH